MPEKLALGLDRFAGSGSRSVLMGQPGRVDDGDGRRRRRDLSEIEKGGAAINVKMLSPMRCFKLWHALSWLRPSDRPCCDLPRVGAGRAAPTRRVPVLRDGLVPEPRRVRAASAGAGHSLALGYLPRSRRDDGALPCAATDGGGSDCAFPPRRRDPGPHGLRCEPTHCPGLGHGSAWGDGARLLLTREASGTALVAILLIATGFACALSHVSFIRDILRSEIARDGGRLRREEVPRGGAALAILSPATRVGV